MDDPRNIEVTPDDLSKPGSKLAAAQHNDAKRGPDSPRLSRAVAQAHDQHGQRQQESHRVGANQGPALLDNAIGQPERHARGEQCVHAERNPRNIARANRQPGLWHERHGGEKRRAVADEIGEVKGHEGLSKNGGRSAKCALKPSA
ncbi:hypothetical protein THICB1_70335 [Thiomonas arsenitoxydans]|uniref:Uncharacterized protein n=1 Tax=Thiomonas arsenitoxydans (strain DSM 22701 / CIP 110005 / 3As) TaxID=426114 RepID=A0ABM9T8P8_THIA3|nr:hypothetical protein THICB1_70335 [Thiomonas arsenitoxydans]